MEVNSISSIIWGEGVYMEKKRSKFSVEFVPQEDIFENDALDSTI